MMLGIALVVVGGTVFLRGLSAKREVVSFGDITVSAEERNPLATWAAVLAVLGGLALVATGKRRNA
jgi:hypothetical protein